VLKHAVIGGQHRRTLSLFLRDHSQSKMRSRILD